MCSRLLHKPWFHLCTLLDKLKSIEQREWYTAQAVDHGWSRNVLVMQIEMRLHERQGRAVTNFVDRSVATGTFGPGFIKHSSC